MTAPRYWNRPDLPGVLFMDADTFPSQGAHVAGCGLLAMVSEGEMVLSTPFAQTPLRSGQIAWVPGGVLFRVTAIDERPFRAHAVFVYPRQRPATGEGEAMPLAEDTLSLIDDPRLADALQSLRRKSLQPDQVLDHTCREVLDEIAHEIPRHRIGVVRWSAMDLQPEIPGASPVAVRAALKLIGSLGGPTPTTAELAKACGVTREHLTREFRNTYWLPPHRWLMVKQVQLARAKLERGMSVMDASIEAGFADQSHMSRWFKAVYLVTPGRYFRTRMQENEEANVRMPDAVRSAAADRSACQ